MDGQGIVIDKLTLMIPDRCQQLFAGQNLAPFCRNFSSRANSVGVTAHLPATEYCKRE